MIEARHGLDLTEGRISTVLLRFSAPFMLANLVTSLYSAVGMLVVGRYTNPETIAAVATGAQILNPMLSFITGIGTGATVIIGRRIGEKNSEAGTRAAGSLFVITAIMIVILTAFTWFCREVLLDLMGTPPEARAAATRYVKISTMGVPFQIGFGLISALFRGMGNSTTPSIVAGISCVINITLSFLFVGAAGMAEGGVAYAAFAAQGVSFLLVAVWLYRKRLPFPFSKKDVRADKASTRFIVTVGVPLVMQDLALTAAFMIITNRVNSISVQAAAAVGVVNRVTNIAFVLLAAIGSAVAAMTAQNIGASKHNRAIASLRCGIAFSLVISVSIFTFCLIRPEAVASVFATDEGVIHATATYLRAYSFEAVMLSFIFCMNSYLAGCGKSKIAMIHTTISVFCFRVPLCIIIAQLQGLDLTARLTYLGISGPVASLFSIIFCVVYISFQQKRRDELIAV